MPSFEEKFESAVKDGSIRGAVVLAGDATGSFSYAKAFGFRSRKPGVLTIIFLGLLQLGLRYKLDIVVRFMVASLGMARRVVLRKSVSEHPLMVDDIMALASCTKLLTSISAMQCVERGLWQLDDDISPILPELAGLEILTGFDEAGKPILEKRKKPITLRLLLTHSAGLSYENHPLLTQYRKHRGEEVHAGSNIQERFGSPLVYEPGTSWRYSPSLDWTGKLVERLTGKTLEIYMDENICAPLEVNDIGFLAEKHPEIKSRISGLAVRIPGGLLMNCPVPQVVTASTDCEGGGGAYASLPAYFEVLRSLLRNDEKLLKKETAIAFFVPQLNGEQRKALAAQMSEPEFVGHLPPLVGWDHGLGGILSSSDDAGWRRKGTLIWTGLFNLIWFIDREAGLCGIFGTQILPSADPQVTELATLFQRTMYEELAAKKS